MKNPKIKQSKQKKNKFTMAKDKLEELNGDARHPLFEIADQNPVFVLDGTVYTCTEGEVDKSKDHFTDKKLFKLVNKTQQVIEVGTLESLDELAQQRAADEIDRIERNYAKRILSEQIMPYFAPQRDLDLPQLIFKIVFPYLRADGYDAKVAGVLGVLDDPKNNGKKGLERRVNASPELKKIAGELYKKVEVLINEIETPKEGRSKEEEILDVLLSEGEKIKERDSILGKLTPRNYAIIKGKVYSLTPDNGDDFVKINETKYGFSPLETKARKKDLEIGDKIRMNSAATKQYDYTKEGSEGVIVKKDDDEDRILVRFSKMTGAPERGIETYSIRRKHAEAIPHDNALSSSKDIESKYYQEVSRELRGNALRKYLSKEKILESIADKDAEVVSMRGKKKYEEEDFGFTVSGGSYYVFLTVPEFAIKSQFDSNLYRFDKARVGFLVYEDGRTLCYDDKIKMIDNNNHPFLHNNRDAYADVCIGGQSFPTSGKDNGDVIAKRLRRAKEMLMFGYTSDDYRSCYKLVRNCGSCERGHFSDNLASASEVKRRNIPVIEGGLRR